MDKELQALFDPNEDTEKRRNMRRCRNCDFLNQLKNPEGSIEYSFVNLSYK